MSRFFFLFLWAHLPLIQTLTDSSSFSFLPVSCPYFPPFWCLQSLDLDTLFLLGLREIGL